ncbi:MAG: hypothetical protein JNN13_12165 [Planctomycetes bacterium]|nr:hypothetical protein [Planctomycetota bacterium]
MTMSAPQRLSGETFARERLAADPSLDFHALRAAAAEQGISLQPIQYGRARRSLGLTGENAPAAAAPVRPARKGSVAFDFLVEQLRAEPTLSYGDLRRRAEAEGHPIAPIMYGRAKAMLGLVPVKPRGSKKAAAEAAKAQADAAVPAAAKPATKPVPMSFKQVESVEADRFSKQLAEARTLEQLVAAVKDLDAERRRLRNLLIEIVTKLDSALD